MKEGIYEWMKNLAVYYILLTAVVNFVPDGKYARYLRYFMGMVLITMLCTPVFSLLGRGEELEESLRRTILEEQVDQVQWDLENVQETYLQMGYEQQAERELEVLLEEKLGETVQVDLELELGETVSIVYAQVLVEGSYSQEKEGIVTDELERSFSLGEGQYHLLFEGNEGTAMAGDSAGWNTSDCDRASYRL